MKGIILAGGRGTRLYPITLSISKHLLPVYDKPMIYYPLAVLMQAKISEILLISTPSDLPSYQKLLGDGSKWGISLSYAPQTHPEGIAQALLIGEHFIGKDRVALILGDNIFYGQNLPKILAECREREEGALIFGYEVKDPERYGVLVFNEKKEIVDIVEKPPKAPSPYAVTGMYFYDNQVIEMARCLKPSPRGELEITDINAAYLRRGNLHVRILERGFAWLDTGTHDALHKASSYVQTIQERQGIKIACLEEIAYQMGFINRKELEALLPSLSQSEYSEYLNTL